MDACQLPHRTKVRRNRTEHIRRPLHPKHLITTANEKLPRSLERIEMQMRPVENTVLGIIESPEQEVQATTPERDIRDRYDDHAARSQIFPELS
jgi:hypothetical protein